MRSGLNLPLLASHLRPAEGERVHPCEGKLCIHDPPCIAGPLIFESCTQLLFFRPLHEHT
jgi:hypothetical protein